MTHFGKFALVLTMSAATAGCGGADDPELQPGPAHSFAVSARDGVTAPPGQVILNLHWFPRGGIAGTLSLRIDGKVAVWGEDGTPPPNTEVVPGDPIALLPETGIPSRRNIPISLPPGTYDLEYLLGDEVVASLPAQLLDVSKMYGLVAYGDARAPSFRLFTDASPLTSPDSYPVGKVTMSIVNLATNGQTASAYVSDAETHAPYEWLFTDLAYGASWEGALDAPHSMMFTDQPPGDEVPQSGFGFVSGARFSRIFLYDRAENTTNFVPMSDGYWLR